MDKQKAKQRIAELRQQVEYHAKRYYDDDSPEISDFEYDMLMNELKNLEKEHGIEPKNLKVAERTKTPKIKGATFSGKGKV